MHTRPQRHFFGMLVILLLGLLALPASPAVAAAPAGWTTVTPASLPRTTSVTLQSRANGKMVSAERTYPGIDAGMLRARATVIGLWEQFNLVFTTSTQAWSLFALANNRYVSAELNYTGGRVGELRARATAIGPWERFDLFRSNTTGLYALQSRANGKYVTVEMNYGKDSNGLDLNGMLRARGPAISDWELFAITPEQLLPVERFSRTSVMQSQTGSLEYAYVDNIGRLLHGHQTDPSVFSSTVFTQRSDGEAFTGQPGLADFADGRIQILGHNVDTDVWARTQTAVGSVDWTAMSRLGGAMTSRVAVGKLPDATLAAFAVDNLGQLWNLQQNGINGPYLNWRNLGGLTALGLKLVGPPTVVTIRDGLQLFAVANTGTVVTAAYRAGALGAWTSLGSGFSGEPAVVALPGFVLRVFARGTDGTIMTKQQDTTGAFPATWTPVSGLAAAGSPAAVLSPSSGRIELVARAADGTYFSTGETAQASGTWRPWVQVLDQFGSPLVAATDPTALTYNDCTPTWGFAVRDSDQNSIFITSRPPGCLSGLASATESGDGPPTFSKHTLPPPPKP